MEKFAFIIHPIDLGDVERFEKGAKGRPPHLVEKVIEWTPPFVISHIKGIRSTAGPEAEGWFVTCPLTSKQFMKLDVDFVTDKITKAARVAQDKGAKIVGLGAYTSIAGDGGITVAERMEIAVTTGNSYTTFTALQGLERATELMGFSLKEARVAVVGATGSIGRVCAQILAKDVPHLILVARDQAKLEAAAAAIDGNGNLIETSTDVKASVSRADAILTVTSSLDAVIDPCDIKPGAVVCDVARPRDVSEQVAKVRDDVLVVDGGVVEVPGQVEFGWDFGFPPRYAYACMSETMILALEGRYEDYSLGKELSLERVLEIGRLAEKHGFKLAGLRSFERAISEEQVGRVRQAAKGRLGLGVGSA